MKEPNSDVMDRIVFDLCSAINTPGSLSTWLCYKHDHRALLELPEVDFATDDTNLLRQEYMIRSYLKKYKGLSTGYNLRDVALEKWFASEKCCALTNFRFHRSQLRALCSDKLPVARVGALLFKAQRKIAEILGPFSEEVLLSNCKWGSGATFDLRKEVARHTDIKMSKPISVTASALHYLRKVVDADAHWFHAITGVLPDGPFCTTKQFYHLVRGSRFLTVPKSAKTDRCIAAEPTGNGFLQQGTHLYMRRRLKRFGIDLGNQTRNQELARLAQALRLATLDLSAASDSISTELVYHLLPYEWASWLDMLRSPETRVNKTWLKTEKFSSMGNATTFELESLIFYALAWAVGEEDSTVSIYGDDIIVESTYAQELKSLLEICGFKLNDDKSFLEGNFYESCGKHYHKGLAVTPPYQKEIVDSSSERVRAHNRLVRFGLALPNSPLKSRIRKLSKWMISTHPDREVPKIPYGVEGDDGYLVDPLTLLKVYNKNHGFNCRVLVYVPKYISARNESASYAYKLRRMQFNRRYIADESAFFIETHETNPLRTGKCKNVVDGHYVYKTRWVSESDIQLISWSDNPTSPGEAQVEPDQYDD